MSLNKEGVAACEFAKRRQRIRSEGDPQGTSGLSDRLILSVAPKRADCPKVEETLGV